MQVTVDGNEAAASVAYRLSETISIYPITPASPMGELSDTWAASGRPNLWGIVPHVMEMQSEAGAAGTLHGALQGGSLSSTFTASQGLLLMIPNMYKIAGELLPTVIHVAARTLATHALSIFGDHSDVMAARQTGFAMLASAGVQEAHDNALIAHAAALSGRVPFLHFFDGFRTSHELAKIEMLSDDQVRALIDEEAILGHRRRRLTPDAPVIRGTAQNPDVFFQAREAINGVYAALPDLVQNLYDRFADLTGRQYHLFDYIGAPDAQRIIIMMGSGIGAAEEAVASLVASGEKVGLIKVRLYRPFSAEALVAALPPTTISVAVLDRTKEPGAVGEPLYQDVVASLAHETAAGRVVWDVLPRVVGGRYGLSSKEFTPAMVTSVYDELKAPHPRQEFTVGIVDDVTGLSLPMDADAHHEPADVKRAVFFGLGSDGTVGANKNSVKIVGEGTDLYAQGYFVYDSRKSGSVTVSHLRFSPRPITSSYLVTEANFVACHQFELLSRMDVLDIAAPGATFLLNSPYGSDEVWDHLSVETQRQVVDKRLDMWVIDATGVAAAAGLAGRVNTVLQACFFELAAILPSDEAMAAVKKAIRKTYRRFGEVVVERNEAAVDSAVANLHQVKVPAEVTSTLPSRRTIPDTAPDFVRKVTSLMLEGKGDLLPVSAMPIDGTFPTGTTKYEKRSIAIEIPIWDPDLCIDCAKCALVCPHTAIRMKVYDPAFLADAPATFQSKPWTGKDAPGTLVSIQVAPDDCTGCGVCVDVCPARSKEEAKRKSIMMEPKVDHLDERANFDFFLTLPERDRRVIRVETVKGSQMLEPLMEFSGACAGCGETPYLKLLSQLFGDRMTIANATGCSSIFGGNLPTTPWTTNSDGRGPAWANSLFEDNAEFGLGMRMALDQEIAEAKFLLGKLRPGIGGDLVDGLLAADQSSEEGIANQRQRVEQLAGVLAGIEGSDARRLEAVRDTLVRKNVWIVGGDGWAYDIGFGGLDHVMASGMDINILVLDTEVYSNTGGQASKATPRAAVAKFAAGGKKIGKKDLGMIASAYGDVYVAQVAIGANNTQTVKAFTEAESFPGPSLIIAYSQCIAHGIDMSTGMSHQKEAVDSGYWPLYRYDPRQSVQGGHPFRLDSRAPKIPFKEFAAQEARYTMLARTRPEESARLMEMAQADIDARWEFYSQMADVDRTIPEEEASWRLAHPESAEGEEA